MIKGITFGGFSVSGETRVVVYEPGDGGRYEFVITDLSGLSNQARDTLGLSHSAFLFTWMNAPNRPSIVLNHGAGILLSSYIREKLAGVDEPTSILFMQLFAFLLNRQSEAQPDG